MVALDQVRDAAFGRRLSVPASLAGMPLGIIAGLGLLLDFEIAVLTSLLTLACVTRRTGPGAIGAWGAAYVLTTGLWVLPAAHTASETILFLIGLPLAGGVFYGLPALLLMQGLRMPFVPSFATSLALSELIAMALGFSLAPIGLAAVGSGAEWIIAAIGVYGATALIAAACAGLSFLEVRGFAALLPVALVAIAVPGVTTPDYTGPTFHAASITPDPIQKWTPAGSAEAFEALLADSTAKEADLRVWPENAVTNTIRIESAVEQIPEAARPVLFGMTFYDSDRGEMRNGAIYVDKAGDVQVSSKERLVPAIESALWPTSRLQQVSEQQAPITLEDGTSILALICYEAAFPVRGFTHRDVSAIFVLAAETGFWQPVGSSLMARHIRAREIETGLPVIKVSDVGEHPLSTAQGAW